MATDRDADLTTFTTRYGNYKSLVLPFGLSVGPAHFQRFINDKFLDILDKFVSIYVDDILVYSNSKKEHEEHVRTILQRLRELGLRADIKKYEFNVTEVKFLGLIITEGGVKMDPLKVSTILE